MAEGNEMSDARRWGVFGDGDDDDDGSGGRRYFLLGDLGAGLCCACACACCFRGGEEDGDGDVGVAGLRRKRGDEDILNGGGAGVLCEWVLELAALCAVCGVPVEWADRDLPGGGFC